MKFLKLICGFVVLISAHALNAEWDPQYLPLEKAKTLKVLERPELIQLENQVLGSIKNTWSSQEKTKLLLELIVLTRPQVCVEVGAFNGSTTLPILAGLQYLKSGTAYIIDAWSNAEAIKGLPANDSNTIWWARVDMGTVKNQFVQLLNRWSLNSYCHILEMSSEAAASQVPPIDFLHLDGNFSEMGALRDSELYLPKVVRGGYILVSNALVTVAGKPTKMKALWPLFEQCDIICEIEQSNALLFKKKI
ncbi:MAG: class I SAM-dependent methyltransferase [Chlamydiota bacterium]